MSLVGLVDRAAGDDRAAQADPPRAHHRQDAVHRRHAHRSRPCRRRCRACASSRRSRSKTRCAAASTRASPTVRARSRQMGARRQPREPADGDARRPRDRARHHLQRLSDHLQRARRRASFISFLAAFLLAYEPAKRLARLNLELNNHLVGVRMLFEVIDSPGDRADRRRQAGAEAHRRARGIRRRALLLSRRTSRCCAACRSSPSPAR